MQKSLEEDKLKYPNATLLRGASYQNLPAYNCLSYALYSQSYDNDYWMQIVQGYENGPWTYFSDGSYRLIAYYYPNTYSSDNYSKSISEIQKGDIFVYGFNESIWGLGPSHIGIVNSLSSPIGVNKVVSKWGAGGLWLHPWADCPYIEETGKNYSVWKLA